jgi:hypothetical protein
MKMKPLALIAASIIAVGCTRWNCGGWYRDASIDATTATLAMHGPIETSGRPVEAAFLDDAIAAGHIIEHYGPTASEGGRPRLDFFFTDAAYRLIYRQKNQELLRGDFGVVFAKSMYYYDTRYKGQATGFEVCGYSKLSGTERPVTVPSIPSEASARLVAVSLVRIVRTHPELAILSATYSADGRLQSLSADAARGGDWVGSSEFVGGRPPINGGRFYGHGLELRQWYGMPRDFPVDAYIADPKVAWPAAGFPEVMLVVHLHYDSNRWVRQDTYIDGVRNGSRYLHFVSTAQDQMLGPIDSRRGFGQWTRAAWD